MRLNKRNTMAVIGIAAVTMLGLSACSSSDSGSDTSSMKKDSSPAASEPATMDPAADLVGSGCAAYAEKVPDGAGSVAGMAQDPVAVAASNNPLLTTLVAAVSGQLNPDVKVGS